MRAALTALTQVLSASFLIIASTQFFKENILCNVHIVASISKPILLPSTPKKYLCQERIGDYTFHSEILRLHHLGLLFLFNIAELRI